MVKKVKKPVADVSVHKKKSFTQNVMDYPVFCFRYFQKECLKNCSEKQIKDFIDRLQRLGELGWKEINRAGRHKYGWEIISKNCIKKKLPPVITPDIEKVMVFRYNNDNYPFVAFRNGNILHILLIESKFGEIYDHNVK